MNQRFIAPAFIVAAASAVAYMVVYATGGQPQLEGLTLFGAFAGLGVGMILWAKHVLPHEEVEQHRHTIPSTDEEQLQFESMMEEQITGVTRRKFLSRLGLGSLGLIGLATIFPLRSLGPSAGHSFFSTAWKEGSRLVDYEGRPVKVDDLKLGMIVTVFPEGVEEGRDRTATVLIRVPEAAFKPRKGREDWAPQGNVAYSKICTHVGCPVGLYRETTYQLLCPCHQSTFDVLDGARAVFGPASRSLPQLPLKVDSSGYLVAQSDYQEPIGPTFWNRNKRKGAEQ